MRIPTTLGAAAALLALGLAPSAALPEPPAPSTVALQGVLHGVVLRLEPYFRWKAKEEARWGVLGTLEGTTREFEDISIEFGGDRTVATAALRAAYEAYRIRRDVERGLPQTADVKPDGSVVRVKSAFSETVYACATRQVGRTVVFARGSCDRKDEAGLVKLVRSIVSGATSTADDVDGWIPPEVKATWTRQAGGDLIAVDDGTLDAARREAALKAVRDAHGLVRRFLGVSPAAPSAPVVRLTANRDLFAHLAGRRDLRDADAVYLPWAAELLVSPRGDHVDAPQVAREGALQACHALLGSHPADPIATGLARQAASLAAGGSGDPTAPSEQERAFARVKSKEAKSWYRLLMMPTLVDFLGEDAEERGIDAELSVGYLSSPAAVVGKASLAAWTAALRKWGHPDAAAEAAVGAMDPAKCDAEFWGYWTPRAEPPKKGAPGKPGAPAGKGVKPAGK